MFRHIKFKMCINYGYDISNLIPPFQRVLMKCVEKLIHVKNTRWLYQNPVKSLHSHCNEFCLKTPFMTVGVTSTRNHLKLTVVTKYILQKHCINIDGTVIIFKDSYFKTFICEMFHIFSDKSCLA